MIRFSGIAEENNEKEFANSEMKKKLTGLHSHRRIQELQNFVCNQTSWITSVLWKERKEVYRGMGKA